MQKLSRCRAFLLEKKWARVFRYVLAGLFVPFIYAVVELFNFDGIDRFFRFIMLHPGSALFGLIITLFVCGVFYLAVRKGWIAATVAGALFNICGFVNYIKAALNGENFMPWDIAMTGKVGELLSFTSIRLPWWTFVLPILTAGYIFALWLFSADLPKTGKWALLWRPGGVLVLCLTVFLAFGNHNRAAKTMNCFGMDFFDAALQSSNYRANGFVGAFTLNLASMPVEEPDGYGKQSVEQLLDGYTTVKGNNKPDVIVILCESFWDIRELPGTEFSQNPLVFYDSLCERDNAYSGTIYSTAIGGGTVRTEFDILTGLTTDFLPVGTTPYQYADKVFSTYVSNYKEQGYTTLALHPYDKTFYSRDKAYGYVGFDRFYGQSEIEQMVDVSYKRGYVSDDSFADAIIRQMEENKDNPTFLFGISMENHQTYYALDEADIEIDVKNSALGEDTLDAVTTYTQGVYHADLALEKLIEYIDSRDKDTVLVFFGDHLPTLGANYAAYRQTGLFNGENYDAGEALTMYGTPFVVYGNFEMKDGIMKKSGNQMSTYYLLDAVALSTDTDRTPYMNLLLDEYQKVPYYNKKLHLKNTSDISELKNIHQLITYDRLLGEQYSQQ